MSKLSYPRIVDVAQEPLVDTVEVARIYGAVALYHILARAMTRYAALLGALAEKEPHRVV